LIAEAIKKQEGDPKRHGVLSIKTSSPEEAERILLNSISNNYRRWVKAGKPGNFIDFMGKRWAPIGAENDPKGLNKNWVPGVQSILRRDTDAATYSALSEFLQGTSGGKVGEVIKGEGEVRFGDAFRKARKEGKKVFMWRGKMYNTEVK